MIVPSDSGWQAAWRIIARLSERGFRALLAGGCVRDMLLDLPPKDYDVATDATPQQVLQVFPKARKVGAKFGVVLVRQLGQDVEVATFRREGAYSDGRHPDEVVFGSEQDDARRRDFTINGLFFEVRSGEVLDYVGGQPDLDRRVLRTIGNAHDRFAEDHLRMLRAVRLAARLDFSIEPQTAEAIRRLAPQLARISRERIWMELEQILTHPSRAAGWVLLNELGLRHHLSSEWPPDGQSMGIITARLAALPARNISPQLGLAAALLPEDHRTLEAICRSLRLSNDITERMIWMKSSDGLLREPDRLQLADLKVLMANLDWLDLLELNRADAIARNLDRSCGYQEITRRASAIRPDDIAPPPLLTGDDLTGMGYQPGVDFGRVLHAVRRAQLNEQISSKEQAVVLARSLLSGKR